jgi:DNA phosphorothioation-associated putative methyltransferase
VSRERAIPTPSATTVGKRVGGALYVHRAALDHVPAKERVLVARALAISDDPNWNVIRIQPQKVALLEYEDFDAVHFPALRRSTLIDLGKRTVQTRSFLASKSPPILHRKELLLPLSDPRRKVFAALTTELERRNLLFDSHKIGMRAPWEARLKAACVLIRDHRIIDRHLAEHSSPDSPILIKRHRTAIVRNRLSAPMQMLVRHGFIEEGVQVFDYGCGQGDDMRALAEGGVEVAGWDPHFMPDGERREADVVNLGFVLNVIEDPQERVDAIRNAWALCRKVMAIAVMVPGHYPIDLLKPFRDGFLTSRGTFQRFFQPRELRDFIRATLDFDPVAVAPGIVLVFRDKSVEQEFLFRRRTYHPVSAERFRPSPRLRQATTVEPLSERLRPILEQLWERAVKFGRQPDPEEVPDIRDALGQSNVSVARAMAWCRATFEDWQFQTGAKRRRDDLLVHFALAAFSESRTFNALPASLRRDVRHFFGSFSVAEAEARRFLLSIGADEVLGTACDAAAGMKLIHPYDERKYHIATRQLEDLPAALRVFIGCAAALVGDADDASVVSMNIAKRSVAFYFSPDFDGRLTIIDRVSTAFLRTQDVNDRRLKGEDRLLFLLSAARSSSASIASITRKESRIGCRHSSASCRRSPTGGAK